MTDHSDEIHELLFSVRRSIRYHERRVAFFQVIHRLSSFLSLSFGTVAVGAFSTVFSHPYIGVWAGIAVALISGVNLVWGFADKSCQHQQLKKDFSRLERRIISAPEQEHFSDYHNARLVIEDEEPPKFSVLDVLCHNDIVLGQYPVEEAAKHIHKIGFFHRWTAQIFSWSNYSPTGRGM